MDGFVKRKYNFFGRGSDISVSNVLSGSLILKVQDSVGVSAGSGKRESWLPGSVLPVTEEDS